MSGPDTFKNLARYYDVIMQEVDYDRWIVVTSMLCDLVGAPNVRHLDVGCGTAKLIKKTTQHGAASVGVDVSLAMLRSARRGPFRPPLVAADMRALPFTGHFDFATCLFDSLNFVLSPEGMREAIREIGGALSDDGLLYLDLITERMVTEHYANQKWTESNEQFETTWEGTFDRKTMIADTAIRVNTGSPSIVRERVHSLDEVDAALSDAGMHLLAVVNAENWKRPTKRTIRLDLVATKRDTPEIRKGLENTRKQIRKFFR